MGLSPEFFRNMTPSQIALALTIEDGVKRGVEAKAVGAKCMACHDTGMSGGNFCSCPKGSTLGLQSFRP